MGAEGVRAWCVPWRGGAGPVPLTFVAAHREVSLTPSAGSCSTASPAALAGWFHCHRPCFREPYGVMDPRTMQGAPVKPKGCCASPSSLTAPLLCNSTECSQAKPWLEGGEDGASPKSLCASPPTCAQLSPVPDVPPWPLTARRALLSPRGFQGRQGGSRPSRREGRDPCGDFRPAGSSVPSVPCLRLSQKMPRREAPMLAVGAIEARTPWLRTAGREGRGCRPGVTTTGREPPQQRRRLPHPAGPVLKAPAGD